MLGDGPVMPQGPKGPVISKKAFRTQLALSLHSKLVQTWHMDSSFSKQSEQAVLTSNFWEYEKICTMKQLVLSTYLMSTLNASEGIFPHSSGEN